MKCPHCLENFFEDWEEQYIENDIEARWDIRYCKCPSCNKLIIDLNKRMDGLNSFQLVRPKGVCRKPLSPEIPEIFVEDYKEACLVMADSPKASAALSRRCLQNLLVNKAGATGRDLSEQIQNILDSKSLPSYLSADLDAVRNIGNFASHPNKSKSTGEVIDVEAGEAEWNLDVLEGLFDFYFIQPSISQKNRDELNAKLEDLGKPPMK